MTTRASTAGWRPWSASWSTRPSTTGLTNLPDRALFRERVGDDLLVAVASRLRTCVRDEDTVARLGGDEFAIRLEQAPSHEVAVRVAGRILEAMRPSLAKARGKGRFERPRTGASLTRSVPSQKRERNPATGSLMPPQITLVLID